MKNTLSNTTLATTLLTFGVIAAGGFAAHALAADSVTNDSISMKSHREMPVFEFTDEQKTALKAAIENNDMSTFHSLMREYMGDTGMGMMKNRSGKMGEKGSAMGKKGGKEFDMNIDEDTRSLLKTAALENNYADFVASLPEGTTLTSDEFKTVVAYAQARENDDTDSAKAIMQNLKNENEAQREIHKAFFTNNDYAGFIAYFSDNEVLSSLSQQDFNIIASLHGDKESRPSRAEMKESMESLSIDMKDFQSAMRSTHSSLSQVLRLVR